jgi:glycosyltransferase involved in cell wall biosynthesis
MSVVYQSCNPIFQNIASEEDKRIILKKYNLPETYLIYVGTIEKRKNLLSILKALHEGNLDIPLVVIGRETPYAQIVHQYIQEKGIKEVYFLKNVPNEDLPILYQMAETFIYPSEYEGFGIPVLEAITSGVPVIAGKGSCLEETGGEASLYVNPEDIASLSRMIKDLHNDPEIRKNMIEKGLKHAENFSDQKISSQLNSIYARLL